MRKGHQNSLDIYEPGGLDHSLLSPKEEKELILRAQNGCVDSRNELIEKNQKHLMFFVKKYSPYVNDVTELMSEANMALISAIEDQDYNQGSFSTFLGSKVRGRARNYVTRKVRSDGHSLNKEVGNSSDTELSTLIEKNVGEETTLTNDRYLAHRMQEELENYEFISDIHEEIFRRRLGGEDPRFIARDLAMDLIDVKRSYQRERALFQEHLVDTIPELGDLYDIDNVERRRKRLAKIIGIDQKDIADYHSDTNTLEDNVYRIADTLEHDTMKEVALKMLNGERKKSIAHDLNISKDMVQKYYDQSKRYIKSQLKTYAWENMNNNISTNRDNSHEHVQKLEETLIG